MIEKVNTSSSIQFYVRNLALSDKVWKYKEEIQELGTRLGSGEVYGVMYLTDIQELDTLLLIIENEDTLIEFLNEVYQIVEDDYALVDAIPLSVAMKLGFQEYIDKQNSLVEKG